METPLTFKQLRQQQLHIWINQNTDFECSSLEIVSGDAGFRRYFRFVHHEQSIIAVDAPPKSEDTANILLWRKVIEKKG